MMPYTHLTQEQRIQLAALLRAGHTQKFTAEQLGVHPSTISRELIRNSLPDGRYHATAARLKTAARRHAVNQRCRRIEHDRRLEKYVRKRLKHHWSPEQVAGRYKRLYPTTVICHETIYQYVYNHPELKPYLRFKATKYRKRRGTLKLAKQREKLKKRWIDDRPPVVDERSRLGDWEGDTVEGKRASGTVLVHVERKSGYVLADKITGKSPLEVRDKTIARFRRLPKRKRHTITYDNGTE
ncbi:MAG: IS30 family transposase, partial [Acidobacteriota bacterium]